MFTIGEVFSPEAEPDADLFEIGWIEGNDVVSFSQGMEAKANAYGPPFDGCYFDTLEFHRMYAGEFGGTSAIQPTEDCLTT